MIFADPPYYLQLPGNGKRLKRGNGTEVIPVEDDRDKFENYEEYDKFSYAWLVEAQRILKPTGSMFVMGMYHNIYRVGKTMQDLGLWFLNEVIRVKKGALPNFNGRRMTNNHETLIWCVKDKYCKQYTFNYDRMKEINGGVQLKDTDWHFGLCRGKERLRGEDGIKIHPTQKPLKLVQQAIAAASNKGDLILDPFFGTGTTGYVAKAMGRDRIGIEGMKKYVDVARKRIDSLD